MCQTTTGLQHKIRMTAYLQSRQTGRELRAFMPTLRHSVSVLLLVKTQAIGRIIKDRTVFLPKALYNTRWLEATKESSPSSESKVVYRRTYCDSREISRWFHSRPAEQLEYEAHLIWGWREFRKDYRNVGLLRSYFPSVPIVVLSATMTNNVLDYVRSSLNLGSPTKGLSIAPISRILWQKSKSPATKS